MLKFINGLLVIAAVGCIIAFVFMAGHGLAQHETVVQVMTERWYLLAGFAAVMFLVMLTGGRKRTS